MPTLYALGGPDVGQSWELMDGAVLGRNPDCVVVLHERSVSRRHARVELRGGTWWVVDMGSRNGLRVAGKRVSEAPLADHAEFVLGEVPLRFRERAESSVAEAAPAEDAEVVIEGVERLDAPAPAAPLSPVHTDPTPPTRAPARVQPDADVERARRAAELQAKGRGGLLGSDLEQLPPLKRLALVLLVLAAGALLVWLAYRGVLLVRAG
jgi:hypothetical protein